MRLSDIDFWDEWEHALETCVNLYGTKDEEDLTLECRLYVEDLQSLVIDDQVKQGNKGFAYRVEEAVELFGKRVLHKVAQTEYTNYSSPRALLDRLIQDWSYDFSTEFEANHPFEKYIKGVWDSIESHTKQLQL